MSVTSKNVLITGANRGIGLALARVHAARGFRVLVGARTVASAKAVVESIRSDGGRAEAVELNLTDRSSIERAAGYVDADGPLDRLINNAGVDLVDLLERQDPDAIRSMFEVNVVGLIDLTRRLLPAMISRGAGHIVNNASISYVGMPTRTTYSATKGAVVAFSDGLRRELRGTGVRVTCLVTPLVVTRMSEDASRDSDRPGVYRMRMPSATRWLSAEAYAERVFRALAGAPAHHTTSLARPLVWVHRHAPRLLDFIVGRMFRRTSRG